MLEDWILEAFRYTFFQAFWSAFISVILGWTLAKWVTWQQPASPILHFSVLPFALPTILISFAWILTYGNSGFVNRLLQEHVQIQFQFLYTRSALIFAHIFVYLGFCWNFMNLSYGRIPTQHVQSSKILGLRPWQQFWTLEFAWLKWSALQCFVMVFLYSLASFSLALSLGAGPENTTTEVAVYQLIRYEYNIPLAIKIATLQVALGLVMASFLWILPSPSHSPAETVSQLAPKRHATPIRFCLSIGLVIFLALPFLGLLMDILKSANDWPNFGAEFWQTLRDAGQQSLILAFCVGVLAPSLAFLVTRQLSKRQTHKKFVLGGFLWIMMALSPTLAGAFVGYLTIQLEVQSIWAAPFCITGIQIVFAIPLCCRILEEPLNGLHHTYHNAIRSLNLTTFQKISKIEWPALQKPLILCFVLAFSFSIGETGASSLLSTPYFTTLPVLLLELMGSYRFAEAAFVSFLLLAFTMISLVIYLPFLRNSKNRILQISTRQAEASKSNDFDSRSRGAK